MFKKPKRNFRQRVKNSDSEEETAETEKENAEESTENGSEWQIISEFKSKEKEKKPKKKKDKSSAAANVLSFGDAFDDGDTFKVKKPSHSRRIAKQLKKESKKEKEEEVKKEEEEREFREREAAKKRQKARERKKSESSSESDDGAANGGLPPDMDFSDDEDDEKDPKFTSVLQSGLIPDAKTIHEARKKRQMARELGGGQDYIPLDDTKRVESDKSRLVREDENDHSDEGEDDERVSFNVKNRREQELRNMQDRIMAVEHGSGSEGSEHEREWEEQQIRKAVSIPQVQTNPKPIAGDLYSSTIQQYMYGQSSNIFQPQAGPAYDPISAMAPKPGVKPQTADLPQHTMDSVKKRLQERLSELSSNNRVHAHERDDMESRLAESEASIVTRQGDVTRLEEQYNFFQQMRGYVRDLVECLNEKVPQIEYIERCLMHLQKARADKLVKRRQEDVKDQSQDYSAGKVKVEITVDLEKQRRVAEREARRTRRRQAREAKGILNHDEGLSTDDEEMKSESTKYNTEKDRLTHDSRNIFEDVVEDFHKFHLIRERFEEWKIKQNESYTEAYIGLCLPKLFMPYVRLKLIDWNPLEPECTSFEESKWYEALMFYGFRVIKDVSKEDPDVKLMPSIIEKVLLPKATGFVEDIWDPLSSQQTRHLVRLVQKLVGDYPTVSSDSKNTQALLKAVVKRIRKTLDDDVFMPLYPKQILENKSSPPAVFFNRQLWSCIKLLNNIMQWQGILGDGVIRELGLDCLLNRYVILALSNSPLNMDSLRKTQTIVSTFPKSWFSSLDQDSTLPQLENLCRYLVMAANTIHADKNLDKREAREHIKQISKLLINIHALDHAMSLQEKVTKTR